MAYIAEERKKLDAKYSDLNNELSRKIYYVGERLPEGAEEVLYDYFFDTEKDENFPKADFEETYILTKNGIKEVRKTKPEAEIPKFEAENIDALYMLADVNPKSFNEICMNLQAIADKHKIIIPKEYL